ncbi:unnamed protein product, partial [Closterium sp. NIES-54]
EKNGRGSSPEPEGSARRSGRKRRPSVKVAENLPSKEYLNEGTGSGEDDEKEDGEGVSRANECSSNEVKKAVDMEQSDEESSESEEEEGSDDEDKSENEGGENSDEEFDEECDEECDEESESSDREDEDGTDGSEEEEDEAEARARNNGKMRAVEALNEKTADEGKGKMSCVLIYRSPITG